MVALKEAFLIKVPKLESMERRTELLLPHYEFYASLVEDCAEALEEGNRLVAEKGVDAVILCAGFSNEEMGLISGELGENVGVLVARGDSRSSMVVSKAIERAGW